MRIQNFIWCNIMRSTNSKKVSVLHYIYIYIYIFFFFLFLIIQSLVEGFEGNIKKCQLSNKTLRTM